MKGLFLRLKFWVFLFTTVITLDLMERDQYCFEKDISNLVKIYCVVRDKFKPIFCLNFMVLLFSTRVAKSPFVENAN